MTLEEHLVQAIRDVHRSNALLVNRLRAVTLAAFGVVIGVTARMAPGFRVPLEQYASLLGDVYAAAAEVSRARVLVDSSKHVSTAYVLRHVGAIDLAVLHLVRDPRAVAHAWTKVKARPDAGNGAEMARYSPLKTAVYYSVQNLMLDALAFTDVPYLRMRYEDFTATPQDALRSVLRLTGDGDTPLDFIDGSELSLAPNHNIGGNPMKHQSGRVAIRRDDAWLNEMRRRDKALVSAVTAPHLLRYRYAFGGGR